MCVSYISLLLIILVMFSMRMVTEGLPLRRWERGAKHDIIAGADFLSVLMDSPALRQAYRELSTTPLPATTRKNLETSSKSGNQEYFESNTPIIRAQRSSRTTLAVEPVTFTQGPKEFGAKIVTSDRTILNKVDVTKHSISDNIKPNGSLVISVQVSSSEGDSRINKVPYESKSSTELNKNLDLTTIADQIAISSEEHQSIVAQASKSEFTVDEQEPITSSGSSFEDYTHEYPANVRPLPNPQASANKDGLQPFEHHSVIYHDNPREPIRGRSVSYSAVIQTLPKQPLPKTWGDSNRERHERHFDVKNTGNESNLKERKDGNKDNQDFSSSRTVTEGSDFFVTSKYASSMAYGGDSASRQKGTVWSKPQDDYDASKASSRKSPEPTEKNWEVAEKHDVQQEKPYSPIINGERRHVPIIYGKPEQNYEIDEAVSVMTNGRAHGVQPQNKPHVATPITEIRTGAANDSQKVGYVVEGRNYRKYRVEERTSDGFIVGEYGVVSHDDGALRGVRYTADGTVNPRLIYDALMKFLSL